jgi:hypothetical protein
MLKTLDFFFVLACASSLIFPPKGIQSLSAFNPRQFVELSIEPL